MSSSSPFDDKTALGLLRLIGRASAAVNWTPEAEEPAAPEEVLMAAAEVRRETWAPETAGEKEKEEQEAPAPEPPEAPAGLPGGPSVRPRRRSPEGSAVASASEPTPSAARLPLRVWRRALVLPVEEAREDLLRVVRWLEAEAASIAAGARDTARKPRRNCRRPSPAGPARGDLKERGVEWIRERIGRLAERVPRRVRALLEKIAVHFCEPGYRLFQMRYEAAANDWHVTLFKRALGLAPKAFALECRVMLALWLLRETSLSVKEIAGKVGFKHERTLRKRFHRRCGLSPSSARNHLRQVRPEHRALGDELLGWGFWVRHHRGELDVEDLRAALGYLENRFGSPDRD